MKPLLPRFVCGLLLLMLLPGLALAQDGTVEGAVTDAETDDPLPGATVQVVGTNVGTATGANGQYELSVPAGTQTIQVSFVGYETAERQVQVQAGATTTADFSLAPAAEELGEVVVTGVATGTQTAKLGFEVAKVSTEALEEVPATDPGNALRGKVAGVQIVQGSGDPAAGPDIRLRGSTSIEGSQQPLIIVDGVITRGGLSDISMQDVESIEVTKGAAASSLYGSLAGNGVIQIRTKDGSETSGVRVDVRTEFGASQVARDYPTATRHPWTMDEITVETPDGETLTINGEDEVSQIPAGSRVLEWAGRSDENFAADGLYDNPFPVLYDNIDNAVTSKAFNTNYVSIAGSQEDFNYKVSLENFRQGGVIEPVDDYDRNTFRVNAAYRPNDRLDVSVNASYVSTSAPVIEEQGQGDNYFYSILTADPYMDVTERNEDGQFAFQPTGYDVQQSNWSNPFYVAQNREWNFDRERLFGGVQIGYRITDNWSVQARQSIDRTDERTEQFYPVGFQTPDDDAQLASGTDFRDDIVERDLISELSTQYGFEVNDLAVTAVAKYLYEDRTFDSFDAFGSGFAARGIRDIGALSPDTYDIGSTVTEERTENYFLNLDLDYQDTYILSGLIRRDGSSLFGADERWQTYFRGSLAYRLTEDFEIPNVSELKLRTSYGSSGNRPPFEAQYETFSATPAGLVLESLGNTELRSSTIYELTSGIDATFLQRFTLSFTYARQRTTDDYLQVPLAAATGYATQYQNIGEVQSSSFEATLEGQILRPRNGPSWNVGLTFARVRQEITDLGARPPFTRNTVGSDGTAINIFRVQEDVPFGAMYGNKLLTSLDQLTVVDGTVLNAGGSSVEDFEINNQGFVIPVGTEGTADEQPVYMVDETGQTSVVQIGNTQPDFNMGFRSNFNWRGLGVYALLDWSQGGEVYNYTKQLLYFNYRHEDQQEFAEQGKHYAYSGASSSIYNRSNPSSYFVEDASYLKLRELALSYTLDRDLLQPVLGDAVNRVKLSIVGRNLFTITDYTGWDPEVGLRSNSTNFRLDEYAYPNFRTFTGSLSFQF